MFAVALLCSGIVSATVVTDDPVSAVDAKAVATNIAAYEEASARAGRDAEAHVRLALWCEAHGLTSQRIKHLARAVLSDPGNVTARSLMGLIEFKGKWIRPEKVAEALKADTARAAAIEDYLQRRARTADTADAQYKLALWCEENGLSEQAVAHLRRVVQLDPKREMAWKRLGYKQQANGRWAAPSQIAREKAESEAQKQADRLWRPRLERMRADLESKKPNIRESASAAIAEVTDPRAVPTVWTVFARGGDARQLVAIQMLGQIDSPGATESLALLAISSDSAEVRHKSVEILRRRDPRDFGSLLANLMRKEIKFTYTPVQGPGQAGTLIVEGEKFNTARRYTPPEMPDLSGLRGNRNLVWTTDSSGLPALIPANNLPRSTSMIQALMGPLGGFGIAGAAEIPGLMLAQDYVTSMPRGVGQIDVGRAIVETQRAALIAEQQLENDVRSLEMYNKSAQDLNRKVVDILNDAADQKLKPDPEMAQRWAIDQLGMAFRSTPEKPKPTIIENVPLAFQPPPVSGLQFNGNSYSTPSNACFGMGTRVHTQSGQTEIETIRAGDQVLTQNSRTGALSYQTVVTVFHNPPNATLKVTLDGGEHIVVTGIHRFWKARQGWVMARELKPGDVIRTIGGTAEVVSVKDDATQPVFNLEVASGQSFFVGDAGMLVHDNSLVSPEPKPFDASPELAAVKDRK
jgi:tetratricopeptide (TPR) repeat protein